MAGGKASAQKIDLAERRYKALELRKAGASYRAIAAKIAEELKIPDYSEAQAHRDVMHVLKELNEKTNLEAEEYRRLELERCDVALLAIYKQVQQGHLGAIDRLLRIIERQSKLLGLDAVPQKQMTLIEALTVLLKEGAATPEQVAVIMNGLKSIEDGVKGLSAGRPGGTAGEG